MVKICVDFDAKDGNYCSFKIFSPLARYSKDVNKTGLMIAFYRNLFSFDLDCRQKCSQIVQIVLSISANEGPKISIGNSCKIVEDKKKF